MQHNLLLGKTYIRYVRFLKVVLPEFTVLRDRGLRSVKILGRIVSLFQLVDLFTSYFNGTRVSDCVFLFQLRTEL